LHALLSSLLTAGAGDAEFAERISAARRELDLEEVDYEATMRAKLEIARAVFDKLGAKATGGGEFKGWCQENVEWLRPYAVFCVLRDLFGTAQHWTWGALASPTPQVRAARRAVERCCPRSRCRARRWLRSGHG
jgi:4-alpha-glucanotransferase